MENPDGIFGINQQRGGNLVIVNLFQNKDLNKKCGGFDDNNVRLQTWKYLAKRRHLLQPDAFPISLVNRVQKFMFMKKPKACNKGGQYERSLSIPELNSKRKNSTISGWRSELLEKRGERCKLDPTRKVCFSLDRRKSSQREYCIPVELKRTQQRKSISCLIQARENTTVKIS